MADPLILALDAQFSDLKHQNIAVAVSGGSDSMALSHALSIWSKGEVHSLIVDHGLRAESGDEAESVSALINNSHVLKWNDKPEARIQEMARDARYTLMADYMRKQNITCLFVGHHMDDQAETFLFRLAKGSGVDGLACMAERQEQYGITLCRPFLGIRKAELVRYCDDHNLEYINDPSNESDQFARVRLRQSMDVLEHEGLSVERLSTSAKRFLRVRDVLDQVTDNAYESGVSKKESNRIEFEIKVLFKQPQEIVMRCLMRAVSELSDNPQRLQRFESLCHDLLSNEDYKKRTLAGCAFEISEQKLIITNL